MLFLFFRKCNFGMNAFRKVDLWLLTVFLVLQICCGQCNVFEEFLSFIEKYGKTYKEGSEEFRQRFLNFQVCMTSSIDVKWSKEL